VGCGQLLLAVWIALTAAITVTDGADAGGAGVCEQLIPTVCGEPETTTGRTSGMVPDTFEFEPPSSAV
jgi:hypothetical protein